MRLLQHEHTGKTLWRGGHFYRYFNPYLEDVRSKWFVINILSSRLLWILYLYPLTIALHLRQRYRSNSYFKITSLLQRKNTSIDTNKLKRAMIVYFKKNDNLINNINNFIKIMFSSNVYKIKIIIPIINLGGYWL